MTLSQHLILDRHFAAMKQTREELGDAQRRAYSCGTDQEDVNAALQSVSAISQAIFRQEVELDAIQEAGKISAEI